jgi:hypothetical protein
MVTHTSLDHLAAGQLCSQLRRKQVVQSMTTGCRLPCVLPSTGNHLVNLYNVAEGSCQASGHEQLSSPEES